MSIFELGMLVCFGISWPVNVIKSIKSKTAKGKSFPFLVAIFIGYISGIIHKLLYSLDFVLYIYIFNFIMVSLDIVLYFINRKRDMQRLSA